jgi:LmbE family N-acetylglucosaminyl deacetylase
MPRTVGKAGASIRKMQRRFRNTRLGMLIALLAAVLGLIWLSLHYLKHPGWWGAGIVMTLVIVLQVLEKRTDRAERRLRKAARQANRGAEGEERVEEILARLPDDHVVIHDLLGDYGNIDHVVVAPHGVFAIETKSHWGRLSCEGSTLLVNGRPLPKDVVAQTVRNALWLRDRTKEQTGLEVFVHAVLVFTRARASMPLPKLKGVQIVEARRLLEVIGQSHGRPIPAGQIASAITTDPVVRH